jgi:hypothetical protein
MLRMLLPSASEEITATCFSGVRLLLINFGFDLLCHGKYVASTINFVAQKEKSKIGRPKLPKGEAKTEMVRARVTPSELKSIERAANGKGVSEWARTVLLSAIHN